MEIVRINAIVNYALVPKNKPNLKRWDYMNNEKHRIKMEVGMTQNLKGEGIPRKTNETAPRCLSFDTPPPPNTSSFSRPCRPQVSHWAYKDKSNTPAMQCSRHMPHGRNSYLWLQHKSAHYHGKFQRYCADCFVWSTGRARNVRSRTRFRCRAARER